MPLHDTLGPFTSRDLLSPYDVANGLNFVRGVVNQVNVGLGNGITRNQITTTTFTDPPQAIRTIGYNTPGDRGDSLYTKITNLPAAPLTNVGTVTSADGTHYLKVPEGSDVYVEAFAAKPGANIADTSFDSWQAFEDCKYWILSQYDNPANGGSGAMTMRAGPGTFYLSKAHSIEGGVYHFQGNYSDGAGTVLRFPWNQDGIQIQHAGSTGQTFGHEGGNIFPGYSVIKGMEVSWSGTTAVYVVTTSGIVGAYPGGTGTGIVAGSAVVDYVREKTWSEKRGPGAGGCHIQDVLLYGLFNRLDPAQRDEDVTVPGGGFHSGIVMRSRAMIQRVFCAAFAGHGFAIVANGDSEVRGTGNVNYWRLDRCQAYYNGHDGIHVGYADANAGVGIDIDVAYNLRWGIFDGSFLGNRWLSCQSAFDGALSSGAYYPGMCVHNGYLWQARVQAVGGDLPPNYHNEPGTDPLSWIRLAGDGQLAPNDNAPVWTVDKKFEPRGAFGSNNINSRTQWYGLYIEGGTNNPQFGSTNSIWGGIGIPNSTHGEQIYGERFSNSVSVAADYSGADGTSSMTVQMGPAAVDGGAKPQAPFNILTINGGDNSVVLGPAQGYSADITGSIADTVGNSASFTGQIGVGDALGANVFNNILFVTATASGTVQTGQTLAGAGIPVGSIIGAPTGFWPNSFHVIMGDGLTYGMEGGSPGSGGPGITSEAMTGQYLLPVLTVTACPPDGISLGANVSGGGITGILGIAKQLDPTTLANIPFTGGVGKYSLSSGGRTIASTTLTITPNLTKNLDFAMASVDAPAAHIWGWTGPPTKRKFGHINPQPNTFFANKLALGIGGNGMDGSPARIIRYAGGGIPDPTGDFKTGDFCINLVNAAGQACLLYFLGTDTGIAGTPKWLQIGIAA